MSLPKITGPMTGWEAKDAMRPSDNTLYVVALAVDHGPWYHQEWDTEYDLIRGTGTFLRGFLKNSDTVMQITVWKD
jgi:hypothetical protein